MAYRCGQGVCCIRGRCLAQLQQRYNHMLHLRFAGRTCSDDGLFDFTRRLLKDLDLECEGRAKRCRPGMTEFECAARIARHEYGLDRDDVRSILVDDFARGCKERLQAIWKRPVTTLHGTACHVTWLIANKIENPETRQPGPWINSEYASLIRHSSSQSCSSISSEISALL